MKDFNSVVVIGNLVREPEMEFTQSGMAICKLSIANNNSYYKKESKEMVEEVSYFDITAFGKTAESSGKYLKKGSKVLVSGRLKQDRWTDKGSGQQRSKVAITAEVIQFLSPINNAGDQDIAVDQAFNNYTDPWEK